MPSAVWIIAFQYFALGVLGIVEMLLNLFFFSHGGFIELNAIFALFIGRGLLKGHQWAQRWAYGLAWFFLIATLAMTVLAWSHLVLGEPEPILVSIANQSIASITVALLTPCLAAWAIWQIRVLMRNDVGAFFTSHSSQRILLPSNASEVRQPSRWQFSLKGMFFATALVALVMLRLCASDIQYDESDISAAVPTANGVRTLHFGVRTSRFFGHSQLTYAVFGPAQPNVKVHHGGRLSQTTLTMPDGEIITHASPRQLYEIVDGRTHSREERVTLKELLEFQKSGLKPWSLDALIEHAEQSRARNRAQP